MKALLAAFMLAAPSPIAVEIQPGSKSSYPHDPAAIVRLECHADDGGAIGTAVKIGRHTYITAAHVVDGRECAINGAPATVTVTGVPGLDFAMLTGPASNVFLPITCKGFKFGRIYLARGYAFGGYALAAMPWLATAIPWGTLRMAIGDAHPGMSGGPLLDKRGRVVGIVNTRWPSMALPLSETGLCP